MWASYWLHAGWRTFLMEFASQTESLIIGNGIYSLISVYVLWLASREAERGNFYDERRIVVTEIHTSEIPIP